MCTGGIHSQLQWRGQHLNFPPGNSTPETTFLSWYLTSVREGDSRTLRCWYRTFFVYKDLRRNCCISAVVITSMKQRQSRSSSVPLCFRRWHMVCAGGNTESPNLLSTYHPSGTLLSTLSHRTFITVFSCCGIGISTLSSEITFVNFIDKLCRFRLWKLAKVTETLGG